MNKVNQSLESFTSIELYSVLFPIIKDIYNSYNYIGINENEYKKLVLSVIEKYQKNIYDQETLNAYFSIELRDQLNKLVNKLLNDNNEFFNIVNKFVDKNIKKGLYYFDRLSGFMKLVHFLINVDYYPNIEEYKMLINNNEIVKFLLQSVVSRNIGAIKTNQLDMVFDSVVAINLIKDYCNINGIALYNEKANCGDDEFYDSFSVKTDEKEYTDNLLDLYFNEIDFPILSIDEEKDLAIRNANGDVRARKILIERNMRYVISVAKEYVSYGIEFPDLIQTGNIGLIKAVDKFDVNKGYRLLTYADYFIRTEIDRYISYMGYKFNIPYGEYENVKKYKYAMATLKDDSKEKLPSNSEIAKRINITEQSANEIGLCLKFPEKYEKLIKKEGDLESQVTSFESLTEEIVEEKLFQEQFRDYILNLNLDDRKIDILKGLWGIFDSDIKNGEELAKKYNITRERIRQIESSIFKEIRKRKDVVPFASYMYNEEEAMKRLNKYIELYCNGNNNTYLDQEFFESIGMKNRVGTTRHIK